MNDFNFNIQIDITAVIITVIAVIAALAVILYSRIKTRLLYRRINQMLDSAIDGTFSENRFDESELSSLENKLWKYLTSSEISARKTAEEKEKIKTLIADISHQTKTPVSNIRLYSELLSEGELSPEMKEYADCISSQSEKLSFLITSLVKLSRLETGIISLDTGSNEVAPMLEDIVSQAKARAEEKGLYLELLCGNEKAVFDPKWTNEAIWNIVDNALKYTQKGGVKISVKDYEMFVCIEIADTGAGISEEEQAQIFSRFYRSSETSAEEGLGIGLYLSRQIISAENGYIKIVSEKGKGSVFSVFLSKL